MKFLTQTWILVFGLPFIKCNNGGHRGNLIGLFTHPNHHAGQEPHNNGYELHGYGHRGHGGHGLQITGEYDTVKHGDHYDVIITEGSGSEEMDAYRKLCTVTGTCPTPTKPHCCWLYHTADHQNCCFCANNADEMDLSQTSDVIVRYHVGGWCSATKYNDLFRHNEFECCSNGVACCVSPYRRYIDPHSHQRAHNETIEEFHNGHLLAIIIVVVGVFIVAVITACVLRIKHKNAASRSRRNTFRNQQNKDTTFEPPSYDYIMRSLGPKLSNSRVQTTTTQHKIAAKRTQSHT